MEVVEYKVTEDETEKIDFISKRVTEDVLDILRKNGFEIREKKNTFQKTEQLLYLMPKLKKAINHNKNRIKDLQEFGIVKSQSGIGVHVVPANQPVKQDESEIVDKEVNKLKQRNYILDSEIKWINEILHTFSNDKYYELIRLKYFENKTHEEIAEYLECDESTVRRNKNRIINNLKGMLFPNDSIDELGY